MNIYCNVCHEPMTFHQSRDVFYLDPCEECRHRENMVGYHRGYNDGLAYAWHEQKKKDEKKG